MKILRALLWVILAVILLVVGGVVWVLFTQSGRDFLVAQVNGFTSTLATPVVLGKLEGNVLRDARLSGVTVADASGIWLTVDGIRLVWHPLKLLDGTRPFEVLEVAKIAMERMPVVAPTDEVASEEAAGNPLDYLVYVPKQLRLADVVVEAPVTGKRHRLTAEIASAGVVQTVSVTTLEGPVTAVSGTVTVSAVDDVAVDLGMMEAPRGLLGGLLKLPNDAGIVAAVAGGLKGEAVTVERLDIKAGQSLVAGRGEGLRNGDLVSGTVRVLAGDLSELEGVLGTALRGKVSANLNVSGSLAKLGFGLAVSNTVVAVSGTRVVGLNAAVSGTVNARDMIYPFAVGGRVSGTLSGVGKEIFPLVIMADVSGTKNAVGVSGSGVMVRKGERANVALGAAVVVSPLMVGGTLDGAWVQGKNRFTAKGAVDVDPVRAVLKGLNIAGPGTVVSGSGVVDLKDFLVTGNAVVKVADLGALGRLAGVKLEGGIDAIVAAKAANGVQTADATVRKFDIIYDTYKAVLKQPARLVWDGKAGSLSPFVLEIAGGTVTAQGRLSEVRVDADLVVKGIDLTQLMDSDVVEGKTDLTVKISGKPVAPVIVANGGFVGVTGDYPLDVKVAGDWRGGKLALNVLGKSNEASATAVLNVGGGLSLMPFKLGIDTGSSLRGTVVADVGLKMFNPILWASRQQVGGRLSGRATVAGTLGEPDVNGLFRLIDGTYSQSTSGVCLRDVGAEIVASRDRVEVRNLKSADGAGGTLDGSARVGLTGDMPLSAAVALHDLKLFCGGVASGQIDGTVGVTGVLADHTVRGALVVGPLNVQIPGASRDADIPHVEVVRVKPETAKVSAPVVTRLAIAIDAPQRIYVRGRGLDAEFGGKIHVGGTANNPLLTGSLTALRGRYTLLDRVLDLAETSVRFEGPIPPSPYLAVKAKTRAQGTDIVLTVTGSAAKPQLALTSEPPLPQDEVLALLLFGRKLANISAFEALKLAQATRVLAGLDGGEPGILDKARQTLGVDTLDIGSGEESGDVTVTTGKYLTDDVYLSIQQGAEPEDRQIKTEIELTPSVTGNTTVDGTGNQSVGVEWKRDY